MISDMSRIRLILLLLFLGRAEPWGRRRATLIYGHIVSNPRKIEIQTP